MIDSKTSQDASAVRSLRQEQAERWQRGERALVEELLTQAPHVARDEEAVLELICAELLLRDEAGERPECAEYERRFPHLTEAVVRQHAIHRLLGSVADLECAVGENAGWEATPAGSDTPTIAGIDVHSNGSARAIAGSRASGVPALSDYEILGELGRGGMGVVYRARHRHLNRIVALKMIRESPQALETLRERFRVEAKAIARLQHPNIVQIYEYGEHEGLPYFSLEYVSGGSLEARMAGQPQPVRESAALVETLARAVAYAHRQGIIHRDLKPANILLAPQDEDTAARDSAVGLAPGTLAELRPRITDFGLAKSLSDDQHLTQTEAIVGTCAYLSPEQAWGRSRDVGPTTDVHALGLILYELLTGRAPFREESLARSLDRIRFEEAAPPSSLRPEVSPALDAICARCLQKEPGRRYPSAEALADDLQRFLAGQKVRGGVPSQRRRLIAAAVVATILAALGIAFVKRPLGDRAGQPGESPPSSASTAKRTTGERFAFLAGVRSYRMPEASIDLAYTEADVDELSRLLLKRGFERKNIRLLTQWSEADNPDLAPTGPNIRAQLRTMLAACIPDDTVVIVVTGMGGDLGESGSYCYIPADARLDEPASLMPISEFYELLGACPAKLKLLLVDTCQTVAAPGRAEPKTPDPPPGVAVVFACSPHEASYEHDRLRHGVFSYHLLRALEGAADTNSDGTIVLDELFQYARDGVQKFLRNEVPGAQQTPRLVSAVPGSTPVAPLPGDRP